MEVKRFTFFFRLHKRKEQQKKYLAFVAKLPTYIDEVWMEYYAFIFCSNISTLATTLRNENKKNNLKKNETNNMEEEGCIKSKLVLQQQHRTTGWPYGPSRVCCHVDTLACKTIAQNVIVVRCTGTQILKIEKFKTLLYNLLSSIYYNFRVLSRKMV